MKFQLNSLSSALTVSAVILASAACSKGGGGSADQPAAAPLSPVQQLQLDTTAKNVSDISGWQTATPRTVATSADAVQASDAAKSAIQSKVSDPTACKVTITEPQQQPGAAPMDPSQPMTTNIDSGVAIGGPGCPISFAWLSKQNQNFDMTAQSMSMTNEFSIQYRGQSTQAQALDIDVYEFNMKVTMSGNQAGANGTITGSGQIVSRSQGTIVMAMNGTLQGNQQGSLSTVVTSMKYPDGLLIEFKNVTAQTGRDAAPVNTYFINNAPVTEKVFQKYTKSFGMDKSGQQTGTAAPGGQGAPAR